jgi:hypothetical protein
MNASPANGTERVEATDKAGEREANASERLAAPEAAWRRETKEPCPMETAKSMGAREINVLEERSATVRRDGEPLANAAKRRRQKETVAEEQQAATGERPSSPVREKMEDLPPLVDDPAGQQSTAVKRPPTRIQSPSSALRRYSERRQERCSLGTSRMARSIYQRLR